jgi:hypothetical protein
LLSNFFQVENIAFINQFYKQTLIKKRIIMMKKKQSKKMNQLKYLVLIPVLLSMLFYTSCSENLSADLGESKKELQTRYFEMKEGEETTSKGEKETYLDRYFGIVKPAGLEFTYSELTLFEKSEYDEIMRGIQKIEKNEFSHMFTHKIFKGKNNRKILATIIDFSKMKRAEIEIVTEKEEVSFMVIDKAPTFPGCDTGDKDCFSKMVQKHFSRNFDAKLPNSLGLSAGKKRVFIGFNVAVNGDIVDVQARAPHVKIKEEVIRVMRSLPKMIPGKQNGQEVIVNYNIPFSLLVDEVTTD